MRYAISYLLIYLSVTVTCCAHEPQVNIQQVRQLRIPLFCPGDEHPVGHLEIAQVSPVYPQMGPYEVHLFPRVGVWGLAAELDIDRCPQEYLAQWFDRLTAAIGNSRYRIQGITLTLKSAGKTLRISADTMRPASAGHIALTGDVSSEDATGTFSSAFADLSLHGTQVIVCIPKHRPLIFSSLAEL